MKFLGVGLVEPAKAAEIAQASDRFWASSPQGIRMLSRYTCLGLAFPGQPANTAVIFGIYEAENDDSLLANAFGMMFAGATYWYVPLREMAVQGGAVKLAEELGA